MTSSRPARALASLLCASGLLLAAPAARAQDDDAPAKARPAKGSPAGTKEATRKGSGRDEPSNDHKAEGDAPTPFPAPASVAQSIHVDGRQLNYTATVGSLPVRDEHGKKIADIVYTAYTLDSARGDPDRPVTFAFNGGPGAASVYLNLGAIGPKRVPFGTGESPSERPQLRDNPGTWLDFTDLVFIDPVGTGFSRTPGGRGDDQEEVLLGQARHRVPVAHRLRLAGQEPPPAEPQVRRRRKLRRLPRPAHHPLPADADGGGSERRRAGLAPARRAGHHGRRPLAHAVDRHPAVHRRRASRAAGPAFSAVHGPRHRLCAERVCGGPAEGPHRPGRHRPHGRQGDRPDRARPPVRASLGRPDRDAGLLAREVPRRGQARQSLRQQRHRLRPLPPTRRTRRPTTRSSTGSSRPPPAPWSTS